MPTTHQIFQLGSHRTHVCGEINSCEDGTVVCLEGWVWRLRELGGVNFFELRDRYGTVQCKLDTKGNFHRFDVLRVYGKVKPRPKEAVRDKRDVNEVVVERFEVLNATQPLPFSMDEPSLENTRLKYRYLDIRNPEMWKRLELRSRVYHFTRNFFQERNFLEVETPVLYKSTPEGARDYLVPSRLYPGHFYALPQSPQTLKQLLMIGGVDRYFQIVRCFRDEDLRSNRQPEFTQLDVECAFVSEKEIISLIQTYLVGLLRHFNCELKGEQVPKILYADAMNQYGTDAPDLRYPDVKFKSVRSVFDAFPFAPFESLLKQKGSDVVCLAYLFGGEPPSRSVLAKLEDTVKAAGAEGLLWIVQTSPSDENFKSNAKKYFTREVRDALSQKVGDFGVAFILGRGGRQFEWMHILRKAFIEVFQIKPEVPYALCWVTPFPLFVEHEDGGITYNHHPFTSPTEEWMEKMIARTLSHEELLSIPARAYDIVLNGQEVGGGSIRIHRPDLQRKMFEILGLSKAEIDTQFGFFLEALGYGAPPHGGIALGMDRLVSLMGGSEVIRDYIAFPKTQNAQCLMSETPSQVDPAQLEELGIVLKSK